MPSMFLRSVSLFVSALWLATLPAPAAAQTAPDASLQRGFLWEARKGPQKIYLLGTLHVGRPDFYPLPAAKMKRLDEVGIIAVEADVSQAQKVGPIVQRTAFYAPGEPGLDTRIDPALKKRIDPLLAKSGLDPQQAWRMKPWMLANTLSILLIAQLGYNPAYSTEAFLYGLANTKGKSLAEVEGLELQLQLFENAPADTQMAFLQQAVKSIESGEAESEARGIVAAWDNGDTAAAERLLARLSQNNGVAERFVREQLVEGRHPRMVQEIEKLAAGGKPAVVAVGSLHYFGAKGLLELLKQRGWTITQIK
jgi:uncharacterized protein YbaP (TraB family)